MQLKRWDRPSESCGRFLFGVIHPTDRGFDLQLVPPDFLSKALKRGISQMGKLISVKWVTDPKQMPELEAGPISIIMGANLRKLQQPEPPKKKTPTKKKESDNG